MKRTIVISCLIMLVCVSCKSKSALSSTTASAKSKTEMRLNTLSLQDSLVNFGKNYLTVPYRYGGTSPKGFDCSGFTSHVYGNFGYNLGRSSRDQANQVSTVQKKDLQTGDLVFFSGRSRNSTVGHVGIVTQTKPSGEFDFIHASVQRGVTISSSTEAYYASRYLRAGRVIDNASATTFVRSTIPSNTTRRPAPSFQTPSSEPVQSITEAVYHTVGKGENIASISKKYDVPVSTIQHLNSLTSKRLKRGQRLLITEAVDVPTMPVAELRKVNYNALPVGTANQTVVFEERKKEPMVTTPPITEKSVKSEKLEPQGKTDVVIIDTKPVTTPLDMSEHRVAVGESLFSIAKRYNVTVDELKTMNNLTSNNLKAGQTLVIKMQQVAVTTSVPPVQNQPAVQQSVVHTVKKGDTLYSIAREYNCSVADLRKWNSNLADAIKIGDKINILK